MDSSELILAAAGRLNPHLNGDRLFGDVASAIITDTGSGTGFCAEHAAIGAMVTAGEYRIRSITAVWRDDDGRLFVLPPCGRCREFIRQIDPANLDTEVVLGVERVKLLRELLPEHEWPEPVDAV